MSNDDPFMAEEAHHNAQHLLDRVAKDDENRRKLERAALALCLATEKSQAVRRKLSSPAEREAMVANILTRIFEYYGSRKAP